MCHLACLGLKVLRYVIMADNSDSVEFHFGTSAIVAVKCLLE